MEEFVNDEFEARKRAKFRKKSEEKWKEVDRQIEMEPMQRVGLTESFKGRLAQRH
jgi:hypothetical protein